jgi:hypothetical protein
VTRFALRLNPVETVLGGLLALPATPEILRDFVAAAYSAPDDLTTIAHVAPAPPMPGIPAERHAQRWRGSFRLEIENAEPGEMRPGQLWVMRRGVRHRATARRGPAHNDAGVRRD